MEEYTLLVDKNDEYKGVKLRSELTQSDIIRISSVWIHDSQGNILLAQRGFNKKKDPGKWGPAVAGTHSEGDTYESNAIRETMEEIGVVLAEKNFLARKKFFVERPQESFFCTVFLAQVEKTAQLTVDPVEVAAVKWFTRNELITALEDRNADFIRSVRYYFDLFEK